MRYLFNFIASTSGGGLKRLIYFSKYFNKKKGAHFIISSHLIFLKKKFKKNKYHIFDNSLLNRFFLDYLRLKKIYLTNKPFDIFYSYGAPVYFKMAKKNYLHISNILPFLPFSFYQFNFFTFLKKKYLKILLVFFSKNADIFFSESFSSNKLLGNYFKKNLFVFQNGDNDQLRILRKKRNSNYKNIVTVVGTVWYKKIDYSFKIFEYLLKKNPNLTLVIIGDPKYISNQIINHKNVKIKGLLKHAQVIDILSRSKYFICSSLCENSYNSISEGVSLAETSIVSSIPPHIEFLRKFKKKNLFLNTVPLKHFVIKNDYKAASKSLLKWENLIKLKLL